MTSFELVFSLFGLVLGLSLAEVLGMRTTAEGVETADQARLLSALGCDFGQGFLFARPMDGKAALDYWRQSLVRPIF